MSVTVFFINFIHFFTSESGTSLTPVESLTLMFFYHLLYFWNIFCVLALFSNNFEYATRNSEIALPLLEENTMAQITTYGLCTV